MKNEIVIKLLRLDNDKIFLYTSKLYRQYDGVCVDFLLIPTFANFFSCSHENKLLAILRKQSDFYHITALIAGNNFDCFTTFLDFLLST